MIYGVTTHKHIGDSIILAGALHNVKAAHQELDFTYCGWGMEIWRNNPDIIFDAKPDTMLAEVHYGPVGEERAASNGNLVEGFTKMLCNHLGIEQVPIVNRLPYAVLTEAEKEASVKWNGKWLLNANCQTYSRSKGYPWWQSVVDGLKSDFEIVQVGSNESRNLSPDLFGVTDWRGKSQNLRDFLSMVYGCAGVISPPSGIVNFAAAFGKNAVVVNGARELAKLSDYPNMTFLTNECCGYGKEQGCIALTFGMNRSCMKPVLRNGQQYAKCMDMISPYTIIRAVKAKNVIRNSIGIEASSESPECDK